MSTTVSNSIQILLLEDNMDDVDLARRELRNLKRDFTMTAVETRGDFEAQVQTNPPDIILADNSIPGYSGEEALEYVRAVAPDIPFIFVSGTIGEEVAIEALQQGAVDYVLKHRLRRLSSAVERALREAEAAADARKDRDDLQRTQQLLQGVIDHSPALISVRDRAGRLHLANAPFRDRFDIPEVHNSATFLDTLVPAKIWAQMREHDQVVREQGISVLREHAWPMPDGARTYLSVGFPLNGHSGGPGLICSIDMDISERKHSDERLTEQARVLDQASDAIFVTNARGLFTYCNQAAVQKSGWPKDEIIGRTIMEVFSGFTSSLMAEVHQIALTEGAWRGEVKTRNRREELLWVDVGVTRIVTTQTKRAAYVLICTDITEKKALTEQFLRVQRLENLGMLAAGIAHDLNNVLSPIGMVATLLQSRLTEERDQHFLEILEKSTNRGAGLVRQILSFAQGSSHDQREVQVKHILRDVLAMLRETFPRNIAVEEKVPSDLWAVKGDATQIHQIVLNLCVNARDAMEEGGQLTVSAENVTLGAAASQEIPEAKSGDWMKVEISDTGHGISAEILEKIWAPFFSTKATGKGTGLGLSTVQGIVKEHQGFLHVKSTENEGTTFQVYLPAILRRKASAAPFDPQSGYRAEGQHILVVDDEPMIVDLASEALIAQGYRVSTANDGEEAAKIVMADAAAIDLLLTDLMMPKVGGTELMTVLKSLNPGCQMILMTGSNIKEAQQDPRLQSLVTSYISKPFEIGVLLEAVEKVFSPATQPPP
jgi:PAS domain S-box-containing protein